MQPSSYSLSHGRLTLKDEALGIDIDEPFDYVASKDLKGLIESGSVLSKVNSRGETLLYTVQDGQYHGMAEIIDACGIPLWRGYYCCGKLHGPSRYFACGKLLSLTWFYHGREYGKAFQYTVEGALFSELHFVAGLKHGKQEHYYPSGCHRSTMTYEMGKLHGRVTLYYEGGRVKRQTHYHEGVRHGTDTIYSLEGVILDEGSYKDGRAEGLHLRHYSSGALREKSEFSKGQRLSLLYFNTLGNPVSGEEPFV